jgi:rapamycin-insensitive companion of mTOR
MSKTELGCQVLQEKNHFVDFAHFIRQHGLESGDPELILKLKSILWAVVRYMVSLYLPSSLIVFT